MNHEQEESKWRSEEYVFDPDFSNPFLTISEGGKVVSRNCKEWNDGVGKACFVSKPIKSGVKSVIKLLYEIGKSSNHNIFGICKETKDRSKSIKNESWGLDCNTCYWGNGWRGG